MATEVATGAFDESLGGRDVLQGRPAALANDGCFARHLANGPPQLAWFAAGAQEGAIQVVLSIK